VPERDSRKTGLARALSKLGYCSRSQAARLIRAGRVTVNGATRRDPETPTRVDRDRIIVDGQTIHQERHTYLMMNKPRGLVTTASDEKGRETVYSILKPEEQSLSWVAPVGRLDKASEGLLLLTNDSEWGSRVSAPETHLHKTHHVQIDAVIDGRVTQAIERGVMVDNEYLRAHRCRLLRSGEKNCWLEITLDEGKNRQIRRLLDALDFEVLRLVRVAIGPLQLGTLRKGAHRSLTSEEKAELDLAMERSQRAMI
jgi:23S rRNA pseudouridine2605 synthase